MAKFHLIQRGIFQNEGNSLTGPNGVVRLDYMGSAEFEWGAIPNAYRRLMYHFPEYEVFRTGIYTPEHFELMVFCKKDYSAEVIQAISEFVEHPYHLKEYSELEKVPRVKKQDTSSYVHRTSDFWWCIDISEAYGNWMAFLQPQTNLFTKAVNNDYHNWWLNKTLEEREEAYKKALRW